MQKRAGLPAAPYLLGKRARLITQGGPRGMGRALTAHPPVMQASRFWAEPVQPKIPPLSPSECSCDGAATLRVPFWPLWDGN